MNAFADPQVRSDYRCVISKPTNVEGEVSWFKAVTIKPGDRVVEVEFGSNNDQMSEQFAGVPQLQAQCDKEKDELFSKKKTECLARLKKLKDDAPSTYPAKLVLMMARNMPINESIHGFVDEKKASESWYYDFNMPLTQGSNIDVAIGTEVSGQGLSAFRRHFGLSFRDNFDLYTTLTLNADDGTGPIDGMQAAGNLLLTCSRMDGKFTDVKADPTSSRGRDANRAVAAQPTK
jgi:hypothetical protein